MKNIFVLLCATILVCGYLSEKGSASTGGFLDGGLRGEYFSSPEISGNFAFERWDVRLDFDWGHASPSGNPYDPGFREVKGGQFAVRWTGRLVSTLGGATTFMLDSNQDARLFIKQGRDWATVVDGWGKPGVNSGVYELRKNEPVEIRAEYRTTSAPAHLKLWWESKEQPKAIIESSFPVAMNHTATEQTFADAVKSARSTWESVDGVKPETDEQGWPLGDAGLIVSEYLAPFDPSPLEIGLNRLSFRGKAEISVFGNYRLVPESVHYDSETQTTTADLIVEKTGANVQTVIFRNAQRPDGRPGITDLKIMRPVAPGADEAFEPSRIFHPALLQAYRRLGAIRFQRVNDQTRTWEERIRPDFFSSAGKSLPYVYRDRYGYELFGSTGLSHEYEILLCNTTGKDYYVTVPHLATVKEKNSYIRNLARLIKYGSDGKDPYTSPQSNPVYPPLNPNLKVYVEVGNELWNFAALATYAPFFDFMNVVKDLISNNDPDFAVLNYDQLSREKNAEGNYANLYTWVRRYWALYLKQISDVFREEFGDEAMPGSKDPRIRPFFTWQYANTNETAVVGLEFMDQYFNNSGGDFVSNPKPVNYYFYSGGGAGYYSVVNKEGYVEGAIPDGGFENASGSWSFSGTGGIIEAGREVHGAASPPEAMEGTKFAYLQGGPGMVSTATNRIRIPSGGKSPVYAVQFRWVGMGSKIPKMKVLVDGKDITPNGANDQPRAYDPGNKWKRVNWWVGNYYFSETFGAQPGQNVEIAFSTDPESEASGLVFLDDVRLTSIDAFYTGGLGSGAAMGQTDSPYAKNMIGDTNWANAYGLVMMSYEHGYSAGGDAGNSPLQDYAKFVADEARKSVIEALDIFQRAGGFMPTFGTYSTWPLGEYVQGTLREGTLNSGDWPLSKGIDEVIARAALPITNGTVIPAVLGHMHVNLGHRNDRMSLREKGAWVSFNVIAPSLVKQQIIVLTSGTGKVRVVVDGRDAAFGEPGSAVEVGPIEFAPGLHNVRIVAASGSFNVDEVIIAAPGTSKLRPQLTVGGADGAIEASWDAIPSAIGYELAIGKAPGVPDKVVSLGNVTSHREHGLENNQEYYVAVTAILSDGSKTLPSHERAAKPVSEETVTSLAAWEFSGKTGNEEAVEPAMHHARVRVKSLVRGPGLKPRESVDGFANTAISEATDDKPASTADEAMAGDDYYEIVLEPTEGTETILSQARAWAFFQNARPEDKSCGLFLAYSVGNSPFRKVEPSQGIGSSDPSQFVFELEKISDLQAIQKPVSLRFYFYGNKPYEFMGFGRRGQDQKSENDIAISGKIKTVR